MTLDGVGVDSDNFVESVEGDVAAAGRGSRNKRDGRGGEREE